MGASTASDAGAPLCYPVGGGRAAILLFLAVHLSVDRLPGPHLRCDIRKRYKKSISDILGILGFVRVANE